MINVILCGCNGKMGKSISSLSSKFPNLKIAAGIDKYNKQLFDYPVFENLKDCTVSSDVVLDFSRPDLLNDIISFCKAKKTPLVLCTTGYSKEQLELISEASKEIPVFKSANMSIGINVINNILKKVSAALYENFDIEIIEKHHNQKVDAPSGTALLLADTIKDSIPEKVDYVYGRDGSNKRKHSDIGIHAIRGGTIIGEHDVIFAGESEIIELKHEALSRDVFAIGALNACDFISGKLPRIYNMDDVIKSKINF